MGRAILSLIVLYVPAIAIALWIQSRLPKKERRFLITTGPGLFVGGIFTYFGAKYFGLAAIARSGHLEGQDALNFGLLCMAAGVIMIGLHFALIRAFPKWMKKEKSKNG